MLFSHVPLGRHVVQSVINIFKTLAWITEVVQVLNDPFVFGHVLTGSRVEL